MKKFISSFLLAVSASSNLLLAQVENKQEKILVNNTANCELPTISCNNQGENLDCHLMMDPAELKNIEEGVESLKGIFGSPEKKGISSKSAVVTTTATDSPIGESCSSINKFLEDEICNNIYTSCLAKVAEMSSNRNFAGSKIEENAKIEWEAALEAAQEEELECNRIWEEAKKETQAAQQKLDSAPASIHGKAYADKNFYEFQIAELTEKLAAARAQTAHITFFAIKVKDSSQRTAAEKKLEVALAKEQTAAESLKEAIANNSFPKKNDSSFLIPEVKQIISTSETSGKTAAQKETALDEPVVQKATIAQGKTLSSSENESDVLATHVLQEYETTTGAESTKPVSLYQPPEDKKITAARKEIAIAEEFLEAAEKASKAAKIAKIDEIGLDKEQEVYIAAKKAWAKAVIAYQEAIAKAKKANLNPTEIKELSNMLKEAEMNVVRWNAHGLEIEAKKSEQSKSSSAPLEAPSFIAVIEAAWSKTMEAYQEAITKAQVAALDEEAEELASHYHKAEVQKIAWSDQLTLEMRKKDEAIQQAQQAEIARQQIEKEDSENNQLLLRAKTQLENATLLSKFAERSYEQAKGLSMNKNNPTWMMETIQKIQKVLEAYNVATEAYKTGLNQALPRFKALWGNELTIAEQEKKNQLEQVVVICGHITKPQGETLERSAFNSIQMSANCIISAIKAVKEGAETKAQEYFKVAETYQKSVEGFIQFTTHHAIATKSISDISTFFSSLINNQSMYSQALMMECKIKASEARIEGKILLVQSYTIEEEKLERAVGLLFQAAQTIETGETEDINNAYSLMGAGTYMTNSAWAMIKGVEASEAGKTPLAESYRKTSALYLQMEQACVIRQRFELRYAFEYMEKSVEAMMRGIEASEAGKTSLAESYRKKLEKLEKVLEFNTQAAQADVAGKKDEASNLSSASHNMANNAEAMMKRIEASEAGKTSLAESYKKVEEFYLQAAQAYAAGKKDEASNLSSAGRYMEKSAEAMIKRIEASETGKVSLAESYKKVEEFYLQAAQACAAGKENEGYNLWDAAIMMESSTEAMMKRIEASEAGKTSLAESYRKKLEKLEKAVEFKTQAAQACAAGKKGEGENLSYAGEHMEKSAEAMMKGIEASEAGKTSLAESYKKVEELYLQAAQAYAAGKKDEGENLWAATTSMESSTKAMMKAIEAKELGNTTLAAEHTAAAEASQKEAEEYVRAAQLAAQPVVLPPAPLPQPTQPVLQPPQPPARLSRPAQSVVLPPAPLPQLTQPVLQPPAPQKTSWFGKLFKK